MQECNAVYGFAYKVVISLITMYKHLNTLQVFKFVLSWICFS